MSALPKKGPGRPRNATRTAAPGQKHTILSFFKGSTINITHNDHVEVHVHAAPAQTAEGAHADAAAAAADVSEEDASTEDDDDDNLWVDLLADPKEMSDVELAALLAHQSAALGSALAESSSRAKRKAVEAVTKEATRNAAKKRARGRRVNPGGLN